MTTYEFVTTFSPEGYHCYGQRFIDSFIEHVPAPLTIYHESQGNRDEHEKLAWRNLDDLKDRQQFLDAHSDDPTKVGTYNDFNGQAIRFCHKVFALHDAYQKSDADVLVWVDADVVWHASPYMESVLPEGQLVTYLGRNPNMNPRWIINGVKRQICSETGFVAYRISDTLVGEMIEDMVAYYTTGEIFTRPQTDWHDAKAFDLCRERSGIAKELQNSLSSHLGWPPDVWPRTILADFATHNKGPARKQKIYGKVCR